MRTYNAPIQQDRQFQTGTGETFLLDMVVSVREILATLSAIAAAAVIVLLSVLATGFDMATVLGAGTWGLGFIFLALAVDNRNSTAVLQWLTGLALFVLAWIQFSVSADYTIASGILVAAWVAAALFRQLR